MAGVLTPGVARASDADALAITQIIQSRHLPYGTIIDPVYASPTSNQIVDYTRCGDSAIWTGHYLAAESFRYRVTGAPDALANMQGATAGIQSLVNVTGTGLLARCLFPATSPYAASISSEESDNGIYTGSITGDQWVGNTSRDQYSGVFFGLAVAYDSTTDAETQGSISSLITTMLDFLRNHAWTIVMPNGSISDTFVGRSDQQLSFMNVGLHVNPEHYAGASELSSSLLADTVPAGIAYDTLSNDSYFKFNLDAINLYNLIRLDTSSNHSIYTGAYALYWSHVSSQQNAFFNMIDRALKTADATRDGQTITMLNQWLTRPTRDVAVNLEGLFASCGSATEACDPVPVPQRPTTDFLWQRDPYALEGTGDGTIESAGIDYILPYWMARYYGLGTSASVINAASASANVAAESIASFYGPNLSGSTASATAVPLPTVLGGVTVQVVDSAGAARTASLFYVSPTQINFEIPAGTVTGQALVNVLNSASQVIASTTSAVTAVSPALFVIDAQSTAASTEIVGTGGQVYLVLYGTGVRNETSLANITCTINGTNVPVTYAGPQGGYAGLDQVNLQLPANLVGVAAAPLVLTVDGQAANAVKVTIPN